MECLAKQFVFHFLGNREPLPECVFNINCKNETIKNLHILLIHYLFHSSFMEHLPCGRHFDKSCPQGTHSLMWQHTQTPVMPTEFDKRGDSTTPPPQGPSLLTSVFVYQSPEEVDLIQPGGWDQGTYPTEGNAS